MDIPMGIRFLLIAKRSLCIHPGTQLAPYQISLILVGLHRPNLCQNLSNQPVVHFIIEAYQTTEVQMVSANSGVAGGVRFLGGATDPVCGRSYRGREKRTANCVF